MHRIISKKEGDGESVSPHLLSLRVDFNEDSGGSDYGVHQYGWKVGGAPEVTFGYTFQIAFVSGVSHTQSTGTVSTLTSRAHQIHGYLSSSCVSQLMDDDNYTTSDLLAPALTQLRSSCCCEQKMGKNHHNSQFPDQLSIPERTQSESSCH